jgi:ribosomal protein L2
MFTHPNFHKKLKRVFFKSIFLMIFQIKKLSFISCLEIVPGRGAQYSRSPGVKSKLLSFEKARHSALVQLPSGFKKVFSYYSFVLLGQLALPLHKKSANGKAGY